VKNTKIANINVTLKDLFSRWLDITTTFHKLSKREKQVLALFLYYHYNFKLELTNNKIIWKMLFDYDTKMLIKQELNIKDTVFQNTLSSLRKKNVIKDNKIINAYIPEVDSKATSFKVIFNLNIVGND